MGLLSIDDDNRVKRSTLLTPLSQPFVFSVPNLGPSTYGLENVSHVSKYGVTRPFLTHFFKYEKVVDFMKGRALLELGNLTTTNVF